MKRFHWKTPESFSNLAIHPRQNAEIDRPAACITFRPGRSRNSKSETGEVKEHRDGERGEGGGRGVEVGVSGGGG